MILASYARVGARASVFPHQGWLRAPATNSGGMPTTFDMKYSTASPRRSSATIVSYCSTWSAGGRGTPSGMYGGSQSASFDMGSPSSAQMSASAAPDED